MQAMKIRVHPQTIDDWPPQPGGASIGRAEHPQSESQAVIETVHVESIVDKSVPVTAIFRGNTFTYDIQTKDHLFAKRLATEIAKHIGKTLQQIGDLDIDF